MRVYGCVCLGTCGCMGVCGCVSRCFKSNACNDDLAKYSTRHVQKNLIFKKKICKEVFNSIFSI